jgi:ribosomal protein S18 acetylase RimI-like enzyme
MNDVVVIRPAAEHELDAVRRLLRAVWHDTYDATLGPDKVIELTTRWHAPAALAAQRIATDTCFLVAERGGQLVGHACATMRIPPLLVLGRLYVLPAHQRRGIGRRLLAAAIAAHPGAATIALKVEAANRTALAFYDGAGFTARRAAVEDGAQVLHLEKPLT